MSKYSGKIGVTTGDVNGVGAEVTVKALNRLKLPEDKVVIVSNRRVLDFYGKLDVPYEVAEVPFDGEIEVGKLTEASGEFSYRCLERVCQMRPKAIVTAPVAKHAMHLAGHIFNGQTEVLQKHLAHDGQHAEMLFVAKDFRVLLLSRHCALKDICLTEELIYKKVFDLAGVMKEKFGISLPKFAICGLNPHAGEDGIIGREELDVMKPAIKRLREEGISITEPLPADTLFIEAGRCYNSGQKLPYDCYISPYHDQGLIPIKTVAGYGTVNMTIGLDIIRTSPGHGTAFDIAGNNIADEAGMIAAIRSALEVA